MQRSRDWVEKFLSGRNIFAAYLARIVLDVLRNLNTSNKYYGRKGNKDKCACFYINVNVTNETSSVMESIIVVKMKKSYKTEEELINCLCVPKSVSCDMKFGITGQLLLRVSCYNHHHHHFINHTTYCKYIQHETLLNKF